MRLGKLEEHYANIHLNYETIEMYNLVNLKGKNVTDLSTGIYNNLITIENIPEKAYG